MAPIGRFPDGTAPRVAILGAGVSGLCMGIQLKLAEETQIQFPKYGWPVE